MSNDKTAWWRIMLIFGAGMMAAFQVGKAPPVLPLLMDKLGLDLVMAGWIIASFNILAVISAVFVGALADRLGRGRMLLAGLVCLGTGSLLGSLAQGGLSLMATRLLEGWGYIFVAVPAPGLILAAAAPRDRSQAMGIWSCFMPTGGGLMMLAAPLLAQWLGWRGLWQLNGLLALAYLAVAYPAVKGLTVARIGESGGGFWAGIRQTIRKKEPPLLAACFGAYGFIFITIIGFLPTMVIDYDGLAAALAGVVAALVLGANAPGNLVGGWLMKRGWSHARLIAFGFVLIGLCVLGVYNLGWPPWIRYGLVFSFSLSAGLIPVSLIDAAAVKAPSPALAATSNGLLFQGSQLGSLLGPPVTAAVVSAVGSWSAAKWPLLGSVGLGLLLAWLIGRADRAATR